MTATVAYAVLYRGRVLQTFPDSGAAMRWAEQQGYLRRWCVGSMSKRDGLMRRSTRNRWAPGYACRWVG